MPSLQFSIGRETGSQVCQVKTLVQDEMVIFLLAELPNLTDLDLSYHAPGDTMFDVAFVKLQRPSVALQHSDRGNGHRHIDIASVAYFLHLPTLTSLHANDISFKTKSLSWLCHETAVLWLSCICVGKIFCATIFKPFFYVFGGH